MRLSQPFLESPFFIFDNEVNLIHALIGQIGGEEVEEILNLASLRLPPITSRETLAVMLGVNPGVIWSLENRTRRYYRRFEIPKGKGTRVILAPRIALKLIQKWIAFHLSKKYVGPEHVFGFVEGRSHVMAAKVHRCAKWVYSIDIKDFFGSTPNYLVQHAFRKLGYSTRASHLLSTLCCYDAALPQGSPASPVLTNFIFSEFDEKLAALAASLGLRLSRYADDIVFSGEGVFPEKLVESLADIFGSSPWTISKDKTELSSLPDRLKVHGLLVHGEQVRLTKGYRNRLRAYKHLIEKNKIKSSDINKVRGHLNYGKQVLET